MDPLKKSNKFQVYFFLAVGVFIFCLLHFRYAFHLFFLEQHQLFNVGNAYAVELLSKPGGLIEYMSEFLIQFFRIPYIGEICCTIFLLFIVISLSLLKKGQKERNRSFIIFEGLIILFLLINLLDITFYFKGVVGYLFCLIALLIYGRTGSHVGWKHFLCGIALALLLFWVASPFQTLFLITAGCLEIKRYGLNRGKSLFYWVILIVSGFLVFCFLGKGVYCTNIGLDGICSFRIIPDWTKYAAWVLLPVGIFFTPLLENLFSKIKGTYWVIIVECLVVCGLAVYLLPRYEDNRSLPIKRLNHYAVEEKWEDILAYSKKNPNEDYICLNYQNLALAKKGILADSLLAYSQNGGGGLFAPWDRTEYTAFVLQEICYHYGSIAFAQRYAFEGNVSSVTKGFPQTMKMLVRTNILQNQYTVAAKYIGYLQQTFTYKEWAEDQCDYLSGTRAVEKNQEYKSKQKYLQGDDYLLSGNDLFTLAKLDKENKELRDFVLCYYLLNKNLEKFLAWLKYYYYDGTAGMPAVYYEAIMACVTDIPGVLQQFQVPEEIRKSFEMYEDVYNGTQDPQQRKEWLSLYFANSYWFYFHYKEIEHV